VIGGDEARAPPTTLLTILRQAPRRGGGSRAEHYVTPAPERKNPRRIAATGVGFTADWQRPLDDACDGYISFGPERR
jgi:hypothetical protein